MADNFDFAKAKKNLLREGVETSTDKTWDDVQQYIDDNITSPGQERKLDSWFKELRIAAGRSGDVQVGLQGESRRNQDFWEALSPAEQNEMWNKLEAFFATPIKEMARKSTNVKIKDAAVAAAVKSKYAGKWIADLIDKVTEAGEVGIAQPALAAALGKSSQQAINPTIRLLLSGNALGLVAGEAPKTVMSKELEKDRPSGEQKKDFSQAVSDEEEVGFMDGDNDDEPDASELDNSISIDVPTTTDGINAANNYKNIILKKVEKLEGMDPADRVNSTDMKALKQFIQKDEVKKALGLPAIKDLVASITY